MSLGFKSSAFEETKLSWTCRIPFDPDVDGAMENVLASATHLFEDPSPSLPLGTESTVSTIISPSAESVSLSEARKRAQTRSNF